MNHRNSQRRITLFITLVAVAAVGIEAGAAQTIAADHHMHIRSAAMSEVVGRICDVLAPCDPEELTASSAEDALAALDAGDVGVGVLLSMGYFGGLPELGFGIAAQRDVTRAENVFIAEEVAKAPERLVGFWSVNPLTDYAIEEARF